MNKLIAERNELIKKSLELEELINSKTTTRKEELDLLYTQLDIIAVYIDVLKRRIKLCYN